MNEAVLTYQEAIKKFDSNYQIAKALRSGSLYKAAQGVYSTTKHPDPHLVACAKYPHATITMDSAFFIHGLTDVAPNRVHLATRRNATRTTDSGVKQYFLEDSIYEQGIQSLPYEGGSLRIYSVERMLVELMRNRAQMPFDYYKEIINSYRRRSEYLDIRAVEDYMGLFRRNNTMFDILQNEVL